MSSVGDKSVDKAEDLDIIAEDEAVCVDCGEVYILSDMNFPKVGNKFGKTCHDCLEERKDLREQGAKKCRMCLNIYPATPEYFYMTNGSPRPYCRPCYKKITAEHKQEKTRVTRVATLARVSRGERT